jgi:hypothetical protein
MKRDLDAAVDTGTPTGDHNRSVRLYLTNPVKVRGIPL